MSPFVIPAAILASLIVVAIGHWRYMEQRRPYWWLPGCLGVLSLIPGAVGFFSMDETFLMAAFFLYSTGVLAAVLQAIASFTTSPRRRD